MRHQDYTIGWICALPKEQAATILDEYHEKLPGERHDTTYVLGRIDVHNVVIACLPRMGTNAAARCATRLESSFKALRFILMVGIGGGVPTNHDIRLGDVVVSMPGKNHRGVIQYDLGTKYQGQSLVIRDAQLNRPPDVLLTAVGVLRAHQGRSKPEGDLGQRLEKYAKRVADSQSNRRDNLKPRIDRLFESDYRHRGNDKLNCDECQCDLSRLRYRPARIQDSTPQVHLGLIASGNEVMRDALERDRLANEMDILCFEMEAGGLMTETGYLVIRGICDYCDSHKNDDWQEYAAAVAAAYAIELLKEVHGLREEGTSYLDQVASVKLEPSLASLSARGARFDSKDLQHDPLCLPGTRTRLLEEIKEWAANSDATQMYWLKGMAGTGKSTIARTVAKSFQNDQQLAATFFFDRFQGDRNNATKLFCTLAEQLAQRLPSTRHHMLDVLRMDVAIMERAFAEQWKSLIYKPLSSIDPNELPDVLFFVIDALDECSHDRDVELILRIFAQVEPLRSTKLRFFLTSRPDTAINQGFAEVPTSLRHIVELHDIELSIVQSDIRLYLEHELKAIRRKHNLTDFPGNDQIEQLTTKAGKLFIVAATACRFISERGAYPPGRLKSYLESKAKGGKSTQEIDNMYNVVLQSLLDNGRFTPQEQEQTIADFVMVVGSIITLYDALSWNALMALLLATDEELYPILHQLHSVLIIPENRNIPIQMLHPSFRDFLLSKERCNNALWISESEMHSHLANKCLDLLSKTLREDICELRAPGILIDDIPRQLIEASIPPEAQYACRYWIYHLQRSGCSEKYEEKVGCFILKHFLHWIEVLSLIQRLPESISLILILQRLLQTSEIEDFIQDMYRFVLQNRSIMETAPLQTYTSALVFSPQESLVRQKFIDSIPASLGVKGSIEDCWGSLLQTLEGHSDRVTSVAFSTDGQRLASGSNDGTVKVWDVATGRLQQTLEGHSGPVTSVAFSTDGQRLASSSDDHTVKVWDTATGRLQQTLEGHSGPVTSVAFSTDGQRLASGSRDCTVKVWDAVTGRLQQTLKGHSRPVTSVAFSTDGQRLASSSRDCTVKVWDAVTGRLQQTLEGHSGPVTSVAFSTDGQRLASGSRDSTVKVWDAVTGSLQQTLEGKFGSAAALISPAQPASLLLIKDNWIFKDNERRIWLPPHRRGGQIAVHGNSMIIGSLRGAITIISINE